MPIIVCLCALVISLMPWGGVAMAQMSIDSHTTFLASFDDGVEPDYAADWRSEVRDEAELVEGKFGKALHVPEGRRVDYDPQGKINLSAGTIEFWLRWTEEVATSEEGFEVLTVRNHEVDNYINFNRIGPDRLGMAVRQGYPEDDKWTWQRIDVDPRDWEIDSWHHLAGVWENGTTRFFVDGELVDTAEDGAGFVAQPEEFTVGPGPLTIDELRISSRVRTPEEIAAVAQAERGEQRTTYLTEHKPLTTEQALGEAGIDNYLGIDEREMPLIIGERAYARGVAVRAPGFVEFEIPDGIATLNAICGASPLGRRGGSVTLKCLLDGETVADLPELTADGMAQPVTFSVESGQTLRIEAVPANSVTGGVAVLGDAILLADGVEPPPSFSRELTEDELTVQQMRVRAAKFTFDLPDASNGYAIYAAHPVDEIDPAVEPLNDRFPDALKIAATPGEYEAAQFTLFADRDLPNMNVSVTELSGDSGTIGSKDIEVQLVRRVLQRKLYKNPRVPDNYEVVSRFLFPNRTFWLPEGNFKQVYLLVHVPDDAEPGDYSGTVRVTADGVESTEMALNLTVRPIELIQPVDKRYGMYYRARWLRERPQEVNDAEFADMAAHGITTIKGHTAIEWSRDEDGDITWNFDLIRTTLDQGLKHGFFGEITIYSGLNVLQRLLRLEFLNEHGEGDPLSENQQALAIAEECFRELKQLEQEYPEYDFLLTQMDEIFGGTDRMVRYIDYSEVIRKTSDFRLYITLHMLPGRWKDRMERSDPWVDVRCINGHSLEAWFRDGHDWNELAQMLAESGDEAWLYHNMRGSFFKAEWNRFINGLFMWISPIEVHVPWMYHAYGGSPFNDTDAERSVFGYAFPHPEDPTLMISTLHYEAFREGYDDMRYIKTLEQTVNQARAAGIDVSQAEEWLDQMRAMLPQLPDDIQDIELESPYSVAAERSFTGADWDAMREQTATHIIRLQEALQ